MMMIPTNVCKLWIAFYAISGIISTVVAEDEFILEPSGVCKAGYEKATNDCFGITIDGSDLNGTNGCQTQGFTLCKKETASPPSPARLPSSPGAQGDPHFRTWGGEAYDFHGICDLVMLSNGYFDNGLGMDIHIRTTRMRMWSYISSLAIRFGEDILEIIGEGGGSFLWNGITYKEVDEHNFMISGYPVRFTKPSKKQQKFELSLSGQEMIILETWNTIVSVHFVNPKEEHFRNSHGLMGSYPDGQWVARDNKTILDNASIFGQEWQVLADESKLFHEASQQSVKKCKAPSNEEMRRRLGEHTVTQKAAENACVDAEADDVDLCMFDVMATNDKMTAGAY